MLKKSAHALIAFAAALCLTVLPAAAQPLPTASPESVGISSKQLGQIGIALQREFDRKTMAGAVVAIARKGKLVYFESFGKLGDDKGTPMPKDAIFPIASMTKPMTVVGALQLYEQGRLMLNEPVGQYLPQLEKRVVATASGTEAARRQPTVQDMMRHTAGVTYGSAEGISGVGELSKRYGQLRAGDPTAEEFLNRLGQLPLQYQPGAKWDYSLGLDVTGMVMEAIAGQRLGVYLQQNVFAPLGMTDTSFAVPAGKRARVAGPLTVDPTKPRGYDNGGGDAWSTASDYLRFAEMLRQRGHLGKVRLLGAKTVDYMTSDHLGPEVDIQQLRERPNLDGYGFGLSVAVRRVPGRSGMMGTPGDYNWGGASGTYFWVDPKEELTVVFMGLAGAQRFHIRALMTALVYPALMK